MYFIFIFHFICFLYLYCRLLQLCTFVGHCFLSALCFLGCFYVALELSLWKICSDFRMLREWSLGASVHMCCSVRVNKTNNVIRTMNNLWFYLLKEEEEIEMNLKLFLRRCFNFTIAWYIIVVVGRCWDRTNEWKWRKWKENNKKTNTTGVVKW